MGYDLFGNKKAQKRLSPDEEAKLHQTLASEQRQRILNYKKFFGEEHGRQVMIDLMNRYHVLTPLPDTTDPIIYEGT